MKIILAGLSHLKMVSDLFNAYRTFYRKTPGLDAHHFIQQRLRLRDSTILIAMNEKNEALGFAQIYPTLSSLQMKKGFILNDLYVHEKYRRQGVAKALMDATKEMGKKQGVSVITLETEHNNEKAKKLYSSAGFVPSSVATEGFVSYKFDMPAPESKLALEPTVTRLNRTTKPKGVVVITGVTSGLGREMVDRFHEKDWAVAGCGRSESVIKKLQAEFKDAHYFYAVDVADPYAVRKWSEQVLKICGTPDLVINNASIINKPAKTEDIPTEEFMNVLDINIMGSVNVVQAFLPAMKAKEQGTIINMSSGWGRTSEEKLGPYCASKWAIEGFTKTVALELPKGMAAVALDPRDGIATPMLEQCCSPEYVKTAPTPTEWSHVAVPYMLSITPAQNGESLTCPPVVKQPTLEAIKETTVEPKKEAASAVSTKTGSEEEHAKKKESSQGYNRTSFWGTKSAVMTGALALGGVVAAGLLSRRK